MNPPSPRLLPRIAAFAAIYVIWGSTYLAIRIGIAAAVSTYAFVNPVVAVALGWALAGEPFTPRTLLASAVIVGSVVVLLAARGRAARPAVAAPADDEHALPREMEPAVACVAAADENPPRR